jgi:hypothetical protein
LSEILTSSRTRKALLLAEEDEDQLDGLLVLSKQAAKVRETKALLRLAERRIKSLEATVEAMDALSSAFEVAPLRVKPGKRKGRKDPHTLVAPISDWHTAEFVEPREVNGLNEHNPDIGLSRADKYTRDLAKMINSFQGRFLIKDVVLAMLGDFLVGEIHGVESARACNLTPIEETLFVKPVLVRLIDHLLAETDCNLLVPCVGGNHDRTTERARYRNSIGYSYMYLVYCDLADHYSKEKRVKFDVGPSDIKFVDIAGFNILLTHGDKGMGSRSGPAGLATPFHTAINKWNLTYRIDIANVGHWHTRQMYRRGFINGSLVGYNSFAAYHNFGFERPSQWVYLVDHERRDVGTSCPVWVD